jgi:hypothetical protein
VTLETSPDDLAALGWDPYDLDAATKIGAPPAGLIDSGAGKGYSLQESIRRSRSMGHHGPGLASSARPESQIQGIGLGSHPRKI